MKFISTIIFIFLIRICCSQTEDWAVTGIMDSTISVAGVGELIWTASQNAGIKNFNKSTGHITQFNIETEDFATNDFRVIKCFNNKVYAGSYNAGLFILDNDTWVNYDTLNSSLAGNQVNDIEYDVSSNSIYIATQKGLSVLNNLDFTNYDSLNSPLPGNQLSCLYLDSSNRLWIGSKQSGLTKYFEDNWEIYNYENSGLNDNYIRTITEDSAGILYIADYFGVDKYDPVNDIWLFVYNTFTSGLSSNQVNKMGFDSTGNFWFATHSGITKSDTEGNWIRYFSDNSNLPHNISDGLFIDESNNVWVATFGGLAVINHNELLLPEYLPVVNISPVPAYNILNLVINISYQSINNITISDPLGRIIFSLKPEPIFIGEINLSTDISILNKGIYFVKVEFEGLTLVKSFVKY